MEDFSALQLESHELPLFQERFQAIAVTINSEEYDQSDKNQQSTKYFYYNGDTKYFRIVNRLRTTDN
jgi:hypothetical protein